MAGLELLRELDREGVFSGVDDVQGMLHKVHEEYLSCQDEERKTWLRKCVGCLPAHMVLLVPLDAGNVDAFMLSVSFLLRDKKLDELFDAGCTRSGNQVMLSSITQTVSSIPERVANALHGKNYPRFLSPESFAHSVLHSLFRCLVKEERDVDLHAAAAFISKYVMLGHTCTIVTRWLNTLHKSSSTVQRRCHSLLRLLPSRCVAPIVALIPQEASTVSFIRLFFADCHDTDHPHFSRIQHLLQRRLLTTDTLDMGALRRLLSFLDETQPPSTMKECLAAVAKVWSAADVMRFGSHQLHENVYHSVYFLLRYCSKDDLIHFTSLSQGIQSRLESDDSQLRQHATSIINVLSKTLKGEGADATLAVDQDMQMMSLASQQGGDTFSEGSLDEDDDIESWDAWETGNDGQLDRVMEEEAPVRDPKAVSIPVYAHSVIEYIRRAKKETQDAEYADQALQRLCDGSTPLDCDDESMATIVGLLLSYSAAPRDVQFKALVTLCVESPTPVLRTIHSEFTSRSYSISDKLLFLDVLLQAADALASIAIEVGPRAPHIVRKRPKSDQERFDIIDQRAKTRRWGSATQRRQPGRMYRLVHVIGELFYPLVDNFFHVGTRSGGGTLDSRLVFTLASLLEKAHTALVPSHELRQMSHCLWQVIQATRAHTNPSVRQSALFAMSCIAKHLSTTVFIQEFDKVMLELIEWLIHASKTDTDQQCQKLASVCLVRLREIVQT